MATKRREKKVAFIVKGARLSRFLRVRGIFEMLVRIDREDVGSEEVDTGEYDMLLYSEL